VILTGRGPQPSAVEDCELALAVGQGVALTPGAGWPKGADPPRTSEQRPRVSASGQKVGCWTTQRPRVADEKEEKMTEKRRTSSEEAKRVGDAIGVDWTRFDLEQFRAGMDVEFEHGSHDPQTDVTGDDPIVTGKIALAHMKEFPDYYERLERMEREAEQDWAGKA
jgi:Protein of unknown function (DUF5661)